MTTSAVHICNECCMEFAARWQLNRHMADSHSKVLFACQHCNKSYPRKPSLNRHMKSHHREEYERSMAQASGKESPKEVPLRSAMDCQLGPELRISEIADLTFSGLDRLSMESVSCGGDPCSRHSLGRGASRVSQSRNSLSRASFLSMPDAGGRDSHSRGSVLGMLRGSVDELTLVAEIMGDDINPGHFLSCDSVDTVDSSSGSRSSGSRCDDDGAYESSLSHMLRTSMRMSINPAPTKRMAVQPQLDT